MKRAWLISMMVSVLVFSVGFAPVSAAPAELANPAWHWVRPGETVFSIGRLYGVNPWTISAANGLANPNWIYAGQHLYIPAGNGYPPPCGSYYWAKLGDTRHSIGRGYSVSPWSIASANGIYNLNRIYAGQRLYIPCR